MIRRSTPPSPLTRRPLRAPALGLLALGALVGCHEHTVQRSASASFTHVDSEGGGRITIDGVGIHFDGSLRYRYHRETGSPTTMTIEGLPFGIDDGVFFIGDREYGVVQGGSKVHVTPAGVEIDGEPRGPLPPSRETPEEG